MGDGLGLESFSQYRQVLDINIGQRWNLCMVGIGCLRKNWSFGLWFYLVESRGVFPVHIFREWVLWCLSLLLDLLILWLNWWKFYIKNDDYIRFKIYHYFMFLTIWFKLGRCGLGSGVGAKTDPSDFGFSWRNPVRYSPPNFYHKWVLWRNALISFLLAIIRYTWPN